MMTVWTWRGHRRRGRQLPAPLLLPARQRLGRRPSSRTSRRAGSGSAPSPPARLRATVHSSPAERSEWSGVDQVAAPGARLGSRRCGCWTCRIGFGASGSFRPSDSIGVFPLGVQGFPPLMVYYLDMSSIVGKRQGNHTYYYLVESARVDGKPRIVSQQYLGSAAEVMAKLSGSAAGEPVRAQYRSFGDLAAVWSMLERLDVAAIIDAVVPRYASAAASVGTYMALATANRIVAPCSKLAFADWWDTTAGPRWVKIRGGVVDHRRFWDAMDRLDEPSLRTIETALGRRIVSEFGVDLSGLVLDMTNFATYIDSTNDKAPIAQRGKAKQKRTDLRLVGLALVVTRDGGIPLVSHAYAGDRLDVTQF